MFKKIIAPVFVLLLSLPVAAQEPGIAFVENKPWQDVLAMAASNKKLIFLDCYTTWCGPCKAMAKEVFPDPKVGAFMNANFINVKQDMEKGQGIDLSKKYKAFIPGYPTYLLINGEGQVVHQVAGYNAADKFLAKINDGLMERSWMALSIKYDKGQRDWPFIQQYLVTLEDAYQKTTVQKVVDEVLPTLTIETVTKDSSAYKVFRKYWTNTESPILTTILASPGIYRKHRDPEREVNEWGGRLFKRTIDEYVRLSTAEPKKFEIAKAQKLIETLRSLHVTGRENMIALLLLYTASAQNNLDQFVSYTNNAKSFGLLRYDGRSVGAWAKGFAEKTTDKNKLNQLLACAAVQENDRFTTPEEFRSYAAILARLGEKEKAQAYTKKADDADAAMKEKLKDFLKPAK